MHAWIACVMRRTWRCLAQGKGGMWCYGRAGWGRHGASGWQRMYGGMYGGSWQMKGVEEDGRAVHAGNARGVQRALLLR